MKLPTGILADLIPPLIQETTRYNLRNAILFRDIQTIHANSNPFNNSFFPATIRAWNNLSDDTKEATAIASFKFRLNRNISKPPTNYNTGSRKGQILHSRMRMDCSSLNSHLFRKNIVADPYCHCEAFESPHYILFDCPRYAAARTIYLPNDINAYTFHGFLFGIDNKKEGKN